MPQTRSSWAHSGRSSAGERGSSNSSSSSKGSVFSRMLGSFRRSSSSRDGGGVDAAANGKGQEAEEEEDPNWANNYKITHHPDRPRQDKRAGLRQRNSVYVLGQLRKMWKYNGKKAEMKRREREARERGFFAADADADAGVEHPGSRNLERREYGAGNNGNSPVGPQASPVPNFSRKAASPVLAGDRWQAGNEEQQQQQQQQHHLYSPYNTFARDDDRDDSREEKRRSRPVSSPSTISAASSDKMTIRVGLKLDSSGRCSEEEESGRLKTRPSGRAETGGYSHAHDQISAIPPPPPSAPKFLIPSQSTSPFLSPEQKEAARRQQRRTLPYGLQQSFQAIPIPMAAYQATTEQPALISNMQTSSARERALRKAITPLHINTDQDSTPALVMISSPASEQVSPVTPADAPNETPKDPELYPTALQTSKICPMPLCDNPLLTGADRKHNLCAECRSDLQPRQSIFRSDVKNPILPLRTSTKGHTVPRTSLLSKGHHGSTAEVAEGRAEKQIPTWRYINGEGKPRTAKRDSGARSANKTRATQIPAPSSQKRNENGNVSLTSRFNKDRKEFRLQPAPPSRKNTRRGISPRGHQTTGHTKSTSDESNDVSRGNHIGFQLAGYGTPMTKPLQRKPSGPLLEPKTFHPPTPKKKNRDGSATEHLPSAESRRRARRASSRRNSGRALSSPRGHAERRGSHRANKPTPIVIPPISPGHRRNRHGSKQHHSEQRAVGWGANVAGDSPGSDSNTGGFDKKSNPEAGETTLINQDIYCEIDNIIDCYLRIPGASETENEKRKAEVIASYFAEVPLDVEMKIKGFI